jgi:uncharacterized membrane protein YphA (DoxX/SURF4 family)
MLSNDWRFIAARLMEILVGGVLLVAGLIKAYEMLDSVKQILSYNIITQPTLVTIAVWLLVVVECALGAALVVGYLRKYVVASTAALFAVFLTFISWSWYTGSTANCGCFGSKFQHSPKEAFIFDAILLGFLIATQILAWKKMKESISNQSWKLIIVIATVVLGLGVSTYASFSPKQSSDPVLRLQVTEPNLFENIAISDLDNIDIRKGTQIVVLMDTGCDHCQANVPNFNQIFDDSANLAPLAAVCPNRADEVKGFQKKFNSKFPIGRISDTDFFKLLEKGDTPRVFLLKDSKVLKIWDAKSPTIDELKAALPK